MGRGTVGWGSAAVAMGLLALAGCSVEKMMWWVLGPAGDAAEAEPPPAPDYTQLDAWAAHPQLKENADWAPTGFADMQATAAADVFFIHPTTFYSGSSWNADVHLPLAEEIVDEALASEVFSIFNGCCRVYAPRYRQAALGAFLADATAAEPAFEVAYGDVKRAFEHFLSELNDDRPFIVASHSQGSLHGMRLLEELDAMPARERLVAAYVPGFRLPVDKFGTAYKNLTPCERPDQVGCIAAWDTYTEAATVRGTEEIFFWNGGDLVEGVKRETLCVNPISFKADGAIAEADAHKGAVEVQWGVKPPGSADLFTKDEASGMKASGITDVQPQLVSAQCKGGILTIDTPPTESLARKVMGGQEGNYHLLDFTLFYADVRANSEARVRAWMAAHPPPAPEAEAIATEEQPLKLRSPL